MEFKKYNFGIPTDILFGENSISIIGKKIFELDLKHILIVTDKGIVKAGHLEPIVQSLNEMNIKYSIYDSVSENPNENDVEDCKCFAKSKNIDGFIGLGGGSSIDTAKGCNFLLTNNGRMSGYQGYEKKSETSFTSDCSANNCRNWK